METRFLMMKDKIIPTTQAPIALPELESEITIKIFLANQDIKQATSLKSYRSMLKFFFEWLKTNGLVVNRISRSDIIEYKRFLEQSNLKPNTQKFRFTVVRKLYEWFEEEGVYTNITKGIKAVKVNRKFKKLGLTQEQGIELLKYSKANQTQRNFAIITLLLRTGVRLNEVARSNVNDIKTRHGKRILMVQGKGHSEKDDFAVITNICFEPIQDYLNMRGAIFKDAPLFVSESDRNKNQRLTTRTLIRVVREALDAIGLFDDDMYTAHSLRHSAGQGVTILTKNIESAQLMLRHKDSSTTQGYVDALKDQRRIENSPEELLDDYFKID